jgi:threonine dehydrogenase-like Zn-dependent dehydrogenase
MRAAVLTGSRTAAVIDAPRPEPAAGEVRVRVEGCGVCASSLPVFEGRPWFEYPRGAGEPGHEGWGVVDALGDGVTGVQSGDRVAFLSGRAFAEYDVAHAQSVVVLPEALDGRLFPGEAVGCALNIFRRSDISAGQTVVVIGAGFLGDLLIQLAKNAGAHVVAVSRRAAALELARAFGAEQTIPMEDHGTIVRCVHELTEGRGAERVIECTGLQWPLDIATDVIAERGRMIIAGYHQDGPRQVNLQRWNWQGIDVVNAHERDPLNYVRGIRDAVDAVVSGVIDLDPLLTHTYALDELERAMSDVAERPDNFVKATVVVR